MQYRELVAISGMGGLFQLLSTKSDGAIVRNLDDNTTKFVAARSHHVTPLESIEVYTNTDNVRLWDVFQAMKVNEDKAETMDVRTMDNKVVKSTFAVLFPEHDAERVYVSDMKKMIRWYGILKRLDLLNEVEAEESEEADTSK